MNGELKEVEGRNERSYSVGLHQVPSLLVFYFGCLSIALLLVPFSVLLDYVHVWCQQLHFPS